MTLLRNIFSDLVEKRLWPLAVVLVAALFVAPGVLSKPATTESGTADVVKAAPGSAAAKAAAQPVARVTLDTSAPATPGAHDRGSFNPFKQQYVPKAAAGGEIVTTGSEDTGAKGSSSDTTSSTTKTKTTTTKGGKKKKTSKATAVSVTLRFGESGDLRTIADIASYTPLPSQSEPFFVFLGVKASDHDVAVFLVSSDAKATGDGVCKPDPASCETIELKAGDTEFFDVTTDGGSKQYQLDLVKVVN